MSLRNRHKQPEIMDQPDVDAGQHRTALSALARINWLSASSRSVWSAVRPLCAARRAANDARPVRVLDVACGGGDVTIRLGGLARRGGYALDIEGCDLSPVAVEHASQRARAAGAAARFFGLNVLKEPIPAGYDVVMCSLFLHHLDEAEAVAVLRKMREAAGELALVNDLARSHAGWWAAYLGTRLLTRSPVVHFDGPVSVEGAFTRKEAVELARQAGWEQPDVRRTFPFRFQLTWRRNRPPRA